MSLYRLESFQDELDNFFGNFNRCHSHNHDQRIDLYERNDFYKIIADLPGIEKDQINIESDADSLEISLNIKKKSEEEEEPETQINYYIKERIVSDFRKKIKFSKFVDPSKSTITFDNGVLTILMPKAEQSKKIALQIE